MQNSFAKVFLPQNFCWPGIAAIRHPLKTLERIAAKFFFEDF
jgi:hypothetical protein